MDTEWRTRRDELVAARDWDGLVAAFEERLGPWDEERWHGFTDEISALYRSLDADAVVALTTRMDWMCFEAAGGDRALVEAWSTAAAGGLSLDASALDPRSVLAASFWQLGRQIAFLTARGGSAPILDGLLRQRAYYATSMEELAEATRPITARVGGEGPAAVMMATIEGTGLREFSLEERVTAIVLLLARAHSNANANNPFILRALEGALLIQDDEPLFDDRWGASGGPFMRQVYRATLGAPADVIQELAHRAGSRPAEARVVRVADPDDPECTGNERALLSTMTARAPLLRVHFADRSQYGAFVEAADGRIKWLGKMKLSLDWAENAALFRAAVAGRGDGFTPPAGADDQATLRAWIEHVAAAG